VADETTEQTTGTYRLIYRSHDLIAPEQRKTSLGELFSDARSNNKRLQLSGALLVSDDWFAQTLEGEEATVRALYAKIEQDPRHDQVEVLEAGPVAGRVFPRWAMARVSADGERDIPLIAHRDGIHAAAPRGEITEDQEGILKLMRDAAHG